jgi:fatty-acyl-CoA synthase
MESTQARPNANPFVAQFPGDPDCIRTLADIVALERIPPDERFPCRSPLDAIAAIAEQYPGSTALTFLQSGSANDEPQRWTYAQYWQEVTAAANLFNELGLHANESVALVLPNVPEMLFAFWGAQMAGIAAPINPFLEAEQIADVAREADVRILVTVGSDSREILSKGLEVQRHYGGIKHVITVGKAVAGTIDWAQAVSRQRRKTLTFERLLTGTETAAYIHTGGTTGAPKLARHTHQAEAINVGQMSMTGPGDAISPRPVILCGLPLFHVNAMFVSALTAIISGGELLLAGPQGFRAKNLLTDFWQLVARYRVTFFAGVPTVFAALLEEPARELDLSSLSHCSSGASAMPVHLLRAFRERTGADILEGYGMTETTVCATCHAFHGERKIGSVGLRLPYQRIRTVVLNGQKVERECDTDEIGVLLLSGPNVITEYKQSSANISAWPEAGWLNSGDMGRIDADGYVWLTGRVKDLIIRGGHNIDPCVTEDALSSHPDVEIAAAVGKPDAYAGEVPIAYVQLHRGASVTSAELKDYASEHVLERAASPVEVIILETLPKTAVGKVRKLDLRKDAIARAYHETAHAAWPGVDLVVDVLDDDVHGLKVLLRSKVAEDIDVGLEFIQQKIAAKLDALTYAWELGP